MNPSRIRICWSAISLIIIIMFSSCMMRGTGATGSNSLTAEIARGPSKNFVRDLDFELFDSNPNVFWSFDHQKATCPSSFHQQVENENRTLGSSSLRFAFEGQPCQAASSAAMASLPEWIFSGQRLRVSVDLKRDAGLFGGVQLAIRCSDHCAGGVQDQSGAYSVTANSMEATDWNSVSWQRVSLDVLAPKGAVTIDLHLLAGFLPQDGQLPQAVGTHHSVLFDNVILEFVDVEDKVDGSSTAGALNPSESDLQSLRKSVQTDVTAEPQIKSIAAKLAMASVVGLGEATHGTREFQNYKVALIKELITHHGFRVVAFEESLAIGGMIDERLNSASGADLLKLLYITWWKTDDVAGLFDWIRAYNAQHSTDPVHFAGFDQFDPTSAVANIKRYLEN
ncbi:MAG: erythromycin esterase family protein [Proteobacteria bacterium]|nr:erythromycin esterase family protein [Pseudomonadota bacterium]